MRTTPFLMTPTPRGQPARSRRPVRAALAGVLAAVLALPALGAGGSGSDTEMPGEVLVKLRSTTALQGLLARQPLTLVSRFGARPIYRLKVIGSARVKDVLAALALEPDVQLAEANPSNRTPEARRNIPWAIGTQGAYAAQWGPQAIRLPELSGWRTGAGVRVAVLDTGFDASHPVLAGRLLAGRDFVDGDADPAEPAAATGATAGHGTHVAGLVALGAPGARILPLRVLDADGSGNAWVLAEAILHALDPDGNPATADGAQVINLSLGSLARTRLLHTIAQIASCVPAVPDDPIGDRSDPGYADDETRCAVGRGAVIVAAAGNDGSRSVREYPAAEGEYGLVAVAATDARGRTASFSNSGNWIELAAPGEAITSAVPGGYATWSGTSMAAPLVAAVAALVIEGNPTLTPRAVVDRLKRSGARLCDGGIVQVDALAAVQGTSARPLACN